MVRYIFVDMYMYMCIIFLLVANLVFFSVAIKMQKLNKNCNKSHIQINEHIHVYVYM